MVERPRVLLPTRLRVSALLVIKAGRLGKQGTVCM